MTAMPVANTPKATTTETIAEAFARTALEHPAREAMSDGVTTLTYAELMALTNQLARALTGRGLRPGQHIGVHLERGLATYQVFLGALAAGLVVVPFNPAHPADYKERMRQVAEPAVTIVDSGPPTDGWTDLLPVTELFAAAGRQSTDPLPVTVSVDAPAFVLFTSGSTGVPKGVVIAHRGIARVSRRLTGYTPGPEDRFLQLAQPSFAASTTDIWTCLLRGGRLRTTPQEMPPLGALAELIDRERITVLNLPVGLFNLLVEHHPQTLGRVSWVIVSGDFPSSGYLERALDTMSGVLFNAFGCTENSALTAVHQVGPEDLASAEVPVGRPMPGVEMTVRDEYLAECPAGQIGELCIAGEGLALGYLGDPEQTGRKFVQIAGKRLLRTGDLAKRTADGEIVLAGRTDQMLKVRGFRVEPRHVELAAESCPGIERAVAQAVPNGGAADELTVWCTPARTDGPAVTVRDLQAHLSARLPDYMVPTTVRFLDAFPLNANGKIDRRELAVRLEKETASTAEPNPTSAHRDELAETIRTALIAVLERGDIGADDAFLDLGVTSLHLIDLGSRLEDVVGVALAPDELFDASTVRGVAHRIRAQRRTTGGA